MAIKDVLILGNPQLRQKSTPITDWGAPIVSDIIKDMLDTMQHRKGIGIAAPQIGYAKRIIMFEINHNPRYPGAEPVPLTILINPEFEPIGDEHVDVWEGCLSVPGLRGKVKRYRQIRYTGITPTGELIDRTVNGMHAIVVQHEINHLDGILFPFRVIDWSDFGFETEVLERAIQENQANL